MIYLKSPSGSLMLCTQETLDHFGFANGQRVPAEKNKAVVDDIANRGIADSALEIVQRSAGKQKS